MGTRADFYVGKGKDAEWIGSIAWDGYRSGIDDAVLQATTEADFRTAVSTFFSTRDDVTLPERGWPWPWDDSRTSDCSYWFFDSKCWDVHNKYGEEGAKYLPCGLPEPAWGADGASETEQMEAWLKGRESVEFPNMSDRKNVRFDEGSGLLFLKAL